MNRRRNFLIIFITVIMLFILLSGIDRITTISSPESVANTNAVIDQATDYIYTDKPTITAAGHPITLWQQDEVYYAFLPAACKNNPNLLSDFPEETDHIPIVWMYSDNIPSVFIDISSDISETINNNKEIKESGMITVLDPNGKISLYQPLEYIKGRGNSSYREFDKKPYQIKLKDSDRIDDKLYAGPIWDYDVSFGNTPAYQGYLYDEPNKLTRLDFNPDASSWFPALYEKSDFYEVITGCYEDKISSYLTYMSETILPELSDTIAASAEMDRTRWQKQYLENDGDNTFQDSITFLSNYIPDRKAFLDRVWIEKEPVCQITLYIEDSIYDIFTVFEGETLPEFPTPEITYASFHGWVSEDGVFPDHTTPVYSDMTFHAYLEN